MAWQCTPSAGIVMVGFFGAVTGLVSAGAKVTVASRKEDACAETEAHLTSLGGEALGIPTLRITNGPLGIGQNDCVDPSVPTAQAFSDPSSAKATALPSATAVAASFDPAVATLFGDVMGIEANNLALQVLEGPGVNMARLPVLGRNFEYFGEDPYLSGTIAVAEIKAVQARGVIAMAKHFAANDQETNRSAIQENIDRRVLHEIYLLPFEMSVKDGDVASVMCSNNLVNGFQMCENKELLTDVLRGQWGFDGYVQSDFFAAKSTVASMKAGLDHIMPFAFSTSPPFTPIWSPAEINAALAAGQLQVSDIDRALLRRYTQMFRLGIFERQPLVQTPIDFAAGGAKARAIGDQSGVLLQNNAVLPFNAASVSTMASRATRARTGTARSVSSADGARAAHRRPRPYHRRSSPVGHGSLQLPLSVLHARRGAPLARA